MARPIFARYYARVSLGMDRGGMAEHRRELLSGLSGRVIEVGAGNGLNFAWYPAEVSQVVAVEPEPYLRGLARANAERAPVPVEVVEGIAERLPAEDQAFDAAVASLMLCSLRDPAVALAEMMRVLRPGGRLYFLEHVRADTPGLRLTQRVLDATVWPRLNGGCHMTRDTAAEIENAGFAIERIRRLRWPETRVPLPAAPHILGTALRPPA
jgi:ubiquinone/menaquinone biosynthesis C-methylase UbiE